MGYWTKARQREAFRKHSREAFRQVLRWMREHEDLVLKVAQERHEANMEATPCMYDKDDYDLERDKLEELADAVDYVQAILARRERRARYKAQQEQRKAS